ncbi:MAG: alpha/beta hydrolase [Luteolibacter sp.]
MRFFRSLCTMLAVACSVLLLDSCVGIGGGMGPITKKDVVFTPAHWPQEIPGNVFRPETGDKLPAVLLIHGGVKIGDDGRWLMNGIGRKLSDRGYYVLNITYRNVRDWKYPSQLRDVQAAIRWMREHAEKEGIDPDRIAVWGYSAGGYLGELAALSKGVDDVQVKAIVAGAAPSDLIVYSNGRLIRDHLGGEGDYERRIDEASPIMHVTKNSPPTFLYHGTDDKLVKPEHTSGLAQALGREGVVNEVFWLHGKGHISTFFGQDEAVDAAMDFLDRHLKGRRDP